MMKYTIGTLFIVMILSTPASARRGVLLAPEALDVTARSVLDGVVAAERQRVPQAFEAVAKVRDSVKELDARKRGRLAPMTLHFKSIGADAVIPMLEQLALDAPSRGDLTDTAWTALRTGLLEAVGTYRDPRATAVLRGIIRSDNTEYEVMRSATEALGKLGDDVSASLLVQLSETEGPKRAPVLAALGYCRRLVCAQALSRVSLEGMAPRSQRRILASLGDVGNVWAWKSPIVNKTGEESAVREVAARALFAAYIVKSDDVQQGASDALLLVDHSAPP